MLLSFSELPKQKCNLWSGLGQCSCCCLHFRFCPSSLEWFEFFFLARAAAWSVAGKFCWVSHLGWPLGRDLISYKADALFWGLGAYCKMPQPHALVGNWHNHVRSMRLRELSETQSRVHWAPIFFRPRRKKMRSGPCPCYNKRLAV